jgi:UDP-glucose 4-epimerase
MAATVLVTGGFGFIGAYVVRELLRDGSQVIVIDREAEGNTADDVLSAEERAVRRIAGDIPGAQTLTKLLHEHAVDTVVHLASPLATVTEVNPQMVPSQMIAPHVAILDACRHAQTRRLVWASSVAVFGRSRDYPRLPIANDAPHLPLTLYGAAKSFLEHLSSHYSGRYGLDTLGLRFPLVYGPGRRRGGGLFATRMIEGAALGRRCVVECADNEHDWVYVGDAARSILLAIRASTARSRALTVCGEVATRREAAEMLRRSFPQAQLVLHHGNTGLPAEFDPSVTFDEIGYKSTKTLRDGLLTTANTVRARAGLPLVG